MSTEPLVTIAVPSFNQGQFLDEALTSIFQQDLPIEVFVLDGGSSDNSVEVIRKWEYRLAGWRSRADGGQASAINEGIKWGRAPFVCWLNSDDWYLPSGLSKLIAGCKKNPEAPAVYGRAWNFNERKMKLTPVWVEQFNEHRLAFRCIISQPATLIKRTEWEKVGGLNENLHFSMDYDLWWRLYKTAGPMSFIDDFVAVNRDHFATKTRNYRYKHYQESISVVRNYYGRVPIKWWISQPFTVWIRTLMGL